jgi:hypothetical protein
MCGKKGNEKKLGGNLTVPSKLSSLQVIKVIRENEPQYAIIRTWTRQHLT